MTDVQLSPSKYSKIKSTGYVVRTHSYPGAALGLKIDSAQHQKVCNFLNKCSKYVFKQGRRNEFELTGAKNR